MIAFDLNETKDVLRVEFPDAIGRPMAANMTTGAVDEWLQIVGGLRVGMLPEVPKTPIGEKNKAWRDPVWSADHSLMTGEVILDIRDKRFGWLRYIFSKDEAKKLASAILRANEAQPIEPIGSA